MLCEIGQGLEDAQTRQGPSSSSYHELARMYQLVVEENNSLKKEVYKVGKSMDVEFPSSKLGSAQKATNKPDFPTVALPKPPKKKKVNTHTSTDQSKLHN